MRFTSTWCAVMAFVALASSLVCYAGDGQVAEQVQQSLEAVRGEGLTAGNDSLFRKHAAELAPAVIPYLTDGNPNVLWEVGAFGKYANTPVGIGLLTAMLASDTADVRGDAVVNLFKSPAPRDVRAYGGHQMRDLIMARVKKAGQAEQLYLLTLLTDDPVTRDFMHALYEKNPSPTVSHVGLSPVSQKFFLDLLLAEFGDKEAEARSVAALQGASPSECLFFVQDLRFYSNRALLLAAVELLKDTRICITASIAADAKPFTLRVCDRALEGLAKRTGADVGVDVAARIPNVVRVPRYADAELATAYDRLKAFVTAMPDAPPARTEDPLALKVEHAFDRLKTGDAAPVAALAAEGDAVLPHLVKYITDPNPEVRRAVIALAGPQRSLIGVGILTALVRDRDAGVALAAVRALYQWQDGASLRDFGRVKLRDNLLEYAKAHPYQVEPLLLLRHFDAQEAITKALGALRQKPDGLLAARPGDPRPAAWLGDTAYPGVTPTLVIDCALTELGDAEAETRVVACIREGRAENVLLLADVYAGLHQARAGTAAAVKAPEAPVPAALLEKYHKSIGAAIERRKESIRDEHRRRAADLAEADVRLTNKGGVDDQVKALDAVRGPNGKLSFEGGMPARQALVAGSDHSAAIFRVLIARGMVDEQQLMAELHNDVDFLSLGWVALLKELAVKPDDGTHEAERVQFLLYRAGYERDKYQPVIERLIEGGSPAALLAAVFSKDGDGVPRVRDGEQERALVEKTLRDNTNVGVRAACADFLAEIGETARAEAICKAVLMMPYPEWKELRRLTPEEATLYGAKQAALHVLFYKVRTDSAFSLVYARSMQSVSESSGAYGGVPEALRHYSDHPMARNEIAVAKTLVGGVE